MDEKKMLDKCFRGSDEPFNKSVRADKASLRPLNRLLDIMRDSVTAEISTQLSKVLSVIEHHLEPTLLAVHLYGSAVDGGLKPHVDKSKVLPI